MPEDCDARLARLERWAKSQESRLDAEKQRRLAEEQGRLVEQQRRLRTEEIARVVAQARQRIGQADSLRDGARIPVVITKPSDHAVERAAVFADLMVRLREYKWADPIVSECDEPKYIAPRAIDRARKHRPDAPWLLYMEDDVILGPDFGLLPGLLREADELFPNTGVVSFFGSFVEPGWSIHPMARFDWLQCAAIRNTDYLVGFRAFIDHGVTQSADEQSFQDEPALPYEIPDMAVRMFLAVAYDTYASWYPSLVQHADVPSVFRQWQMKRGSRSHKQANG
jgi:hypothetical protein